MYKVILSNKVIKEIDELPDNVFDKFDEVIQKLKSNPRPIGCMKLTDQEGYRVRFGKYRIIYTINDKLQEISVFKISHRKESYRR
jgi:mRNA interferase RelE/StbE